MTAFSDPIPAPGAEGIFTPPDPGKSTGPEIPGNVKKLLGKMGGNKRTTPTGKPSRGAPRPLTDEDRVKITDAYTFVGMSLMLFKPDVSAAILDPTRVRHEDGSFTLDGPTRAELCADAWMELAEENDSVRRVVLFFVETGAWGKLFAVNAPILMAAMPDDALARLFQRIMPNMPDITVPMPSQPGMGFDPTIVNGGQAG